MGKRIFGIFILSVLILFTDRTYADTAAYIYDSLNRLVRADYGDGAYAGYSYDDAGNMTRRVFQDGQPFMVKLAEFRADTDNGCVLLTWKTLSETDTAGFHIMRSDSEDGEYRRITGLMIPSAGGSTETALYTYRDIDTVQGKTYYYRLEDADYRGAGTYSGYVSSGGEDFLRVLIRILQINAGVKMSLSSDMREDVTGDGKAGLGDAVMLLQIISGVRKD